MSRTKTASWWKKVVDGNVYLYTNHTVRAFAMYDLLALNDEQLNIVLHAMNRACQSVLSVAAGVHRDGDDLSGIEKAFAPRHEWHKQKEHVMQGRKGAKVQLLKNVWVCQRCMMWTSNVKQYKNEPCKVHTGH